MWYITLIHGFTLERGRLAIRDGRAMTVREMLEAAREAAIEVRRIEEEAVIRREAIGVQGYSIGVHPKTGIFDSTARIDAFVDWQAERVSSAELRRPIAEAHELMAGISRVICDPVTIEVMTRYYCEGETYRSIIDGDGRVPALTDRTDVLDGLTRTEQFSCLQRAVSAVVSQCEAVGIARLKEIGRS